MDRERIWAAEKGLVTDLPTRQIGAFSAENEATCGQLHHDVGVFTGQCSVWQAHFGGVGIGETYLIRLEFRRVGEAGTQQNSGCHSNACLRYGGL